MENYLEFDGKYYAFSLEKMMEFIFKTDENEKESIITQNYGILEDDNLGLMSKEVSEKTYSISDTKSNYRYNIITSMINLITVPITDGSGSALLTNNSSEMYLGQRIAFNTLLENEIIYEIDFDNE